MLSSVTSLGELKGFSGTKEGLLSQDGDPMYKLLKDDNLQKLMIQTIQKSTQWLGWQKNPENKILHFADNGDLVCNLVLHT